MHESRKFTCFLMGARSRLIQCGEILLQRGHKICGVISAETPILRWVREKNLQQILPNADIVELLKQQPFDLFFSIDNFLKVRNEILTLPRIFAINFHDAPLPRYAGNNATNWALMNREIVHGITWHVMTDVIDAGDILKQKTFLILDEETALILNAKCYEKSIEGFAELMDELAENRVKPVQQDLKKRTFFPRWKRPPAACTIDWTHSAEEIYALFRALDYGSYPNPLGLPKLFLGDQAVIVKQMEVLTSKHEHDVTPGTITLVTNETINVATGNQEVALRKFITFNGEPLSPSTFLVKCGLCEGEKLPKLKEEFADTLTRINSALCKHEEYWIQRLASLEPIEIPYAKRRTLCDGNPQYSETRFSTPVPTLASFQIFENPGDILLAAFVLYLSRIGSKESFDVNYRDAALQQDLSNTEIFFASHVPLRIAVEYEQRFEQFYKKIQEQIKSLRAHGSYPRDLVFRDPVLHEKYNGQFCSRLPVALERVESLSGYQLKCDTDLVIVIPDDGKELAWLYDQEVLDKTAIDRMVNNFQTLMKDITSNPKRPISEFSCLSENEKEQILIEWNNTKVDYPANKLIHQLFEAQVEQTPDAIAVVFEGETLTYRELNERANQVAHYLQSIGIGPDVPVGVAFERSLEMVVALYGILKAGGAYLPVDPTYPAERITYMLENSQVPVLLTQSKVLNKLPQYQGKVICLDTNWNDIIRGQSRENPFSKVTLKDLAYVIYTSGSTGKPKGVMNTHRGILNRLLWMQDAYQLTSSDLVLQKTPFSFDVSVWEFFWPLMFGACLVVARPEGHKDNDYLIQIIIDRQITTIHFVPSMLQLFLESNNVDRCVSLRNVICSGEVLPVDLKDRFLSKLNARLHNLYGPTEAAVDVTYYECQRESKLRTVPIGRPIANTRIYILDRSMQPVPIGVVGELHIGGVQVARGYLNRPELTAERFIPDPFSEDPEARLYKTGDLARYLPDGNIEYLGRMDYQVKIRGLRIELDEIESVLSEHPAVREAVVLVREDVPGDKRLVAYIVQGKDSPISITELRSFLEKKLPEYMLPAGYVELEALPLTPNGKVDRRALPAPEYKRQTDVDYIAPQNELHKTIASIWKELLRVEKVGIRDNFFELGGNSLLLVQAYHRLSDIVNRELSVTDMFRFPTIEKLSTYLLQEKSEDSSFGRIFNRTRKQREIFNRQKELRNKKMKNFR